MYIYCMLRCKKVPSILALLAYPHFPIHQPVPKLCIYLVDRARAPLLLYLVASV